MCLFGYSSSQTHLSYVTVSYCIKGKQKQNYSSLFLTLVRKTSKTIETEIRENLSVGAVTSEPLRNLYMR